MSRFNPISAASLLTNSGRIVRATSDYNATLERIATGKRINRASDDPSALVALEGSLKPDATRLDRQIASLERANLYYGARDGALAALGDLTLQLDAIVVQAGNRGALSDEELDALQIQADSIVGSIDFLSQTYTYQDEQVLSGYTSVALGLSGTIDLRAEDLEAVQAAADAASDRVTRDRAALGNRIRENESLIAAKSEEFINLSGEISRLEDADYAREVSNLVRQEVLIEASIKAELISREQSRAVLELLESATTLANA